MPTVHSIISRGYFPQELPPPFTTIEYANFLVHNSSILPGYSGQQSRISRSATHNLARRGTLRRRLGIPNPINFYQLAAFTVDNWSDLFVAATRSSISLTSPVDSTSVASRALEWKDNLKQRPIHASRVRSTSRYILQADISRFYHSIFTHSIPWAIHTKPTAKADRSDALIGNVLDKLIRYCQDGQTIGIPVGPDISLLIAEIILGAVDEILRSRGITNGFRYIDDYEFGFSTLADAERALAILQEALSDYELALNPSKTQIIKLPQEIESLHIAELRTAQISSAQSTQRSDIINYFNRAFMIYNQHPEEVILKYAISRLRSEQIHPDNWQLYENLLLQSAVTEPDTVSYILDQLISYRSLGYSLNTDNIGDVFNMIIKQNAPLGYGNDVAWAVWGLIAMGIPLGIDSTNSASSMNDSIVALLLLDAQSKSLIPGAVDFTNLQSFMTGDDLHGEQWLLAYEANLKGWLSSASTTGYVDNDDHFSHLNTNGVYFYDTTVVPPVKPIAPKEPEEEY